jgi:hypothetical protein
MMGENLVCKWTQASIADDTQGKGSTIFCICYDVLGRLPTHWTQSMELAPLVPPASERLATSWPLGVLPGQ